MLPLLMTDKEPISRVTWDGRTIVDVNRLLRTPKVRKMLETLDKKVSQEGRMRGTKSGYKT